MRANSSQSLSLKIRLGVIATTIALVTASLTGITQSAEAKSLCSDGWVSGSSGSGTCSWHGGIANGYVFLPGTYTTYKTPTDFRVRKYANCTALRAQFVFGVRNKIVYSSSYYSPFYFTALYAKNKAMDVNKDGAICEVRKIVPTVTTPTPTPTPQPELGTKLNPARPGQTVEASGIQFKLLAAPQEASSRLCSFKTLVPMQGCVYRKNTYGAIEENAGVDPASSRMWMAVNLEVRRTSTSSRLYPFFSWNFALYSNSDNSQWQHPYAPNFSLVDFEPFKLDEARTVTLYISVPKSADMNATVFGILDVGGAWAQENNRYFTGLR